MNMTKTLIAYHSRTGVTRRIARLLAKRLGADREEIRIVQPLPGWLGDIMCGIEALGGLSPALRPPRRNSAEYDLVIVGTPVWFWSPSSPVRSWLQQNRLRGRRFAFFCTMGGSGASRALSMMKQLAGGRPLATMALTRQEVDSGDVARLDDFVRALRGGRGRTTTAMTAAAHAG